MMLVSVLCLPLQDGSIGHPPLRTVHESESAYAKEDPSTGGSWSMKSSYGFLLTNIGGLDVCAYMPAKPKAVHQLHPLQNM